MTRFDDAIVGAGIMGLAHAYALGRRGRRVVVFERSPSACGASVRNFGMLWPIGQPAGFALRTALRSRELWLSVLQSSGLWHDQCGSLHVAYAEDEAAVLHQFLATAGENGYDCAWRDPGQVAELSPAINRHGLRGGMWSTTEICVDPREVISRLPAWLNASYGVQFEFNCAVTSYDHPEVRAGGRTWRAEQLFVCSGTDFETLYPQAFAASGLQRVKLQMMRSQPLSDTVSIGPMLAAGLTLCHYRAFQNCPELPALRARFARELPQHVQYGIHVMAAQNGLGQIIIGDSHEYGDQISPFDKDVIDELILDYLRQFLTIPQLKIESRWHGTYASHPAEMCWTSRPAPGAMIVASPSGRGMTMSFGIGEQIVRKALGETLEDSWNMGGD